MKNWTDYGAAPTVRKAVEKLNDANIGRSAIVTYNNDRNNKHTASGYFFVWGSQGDTDPAKEWKYLISSYVPSTIAGWMDDYSIDQNCAIVMLDNDRKFSLLGYVPKDLEIKGS